MKLTGACDMGKYMNVDIKRNAVASNKRPSIYGHWVHLTSYRNIINPSRFLDSNRVNFNL